MPEALRKVIARKLARRQSQRCPYLFSVAPEGFDAGVDAAITPPSRPGFPPTHELLDQAWQRYLAAMENVLTHQPYLLGERFTLADASAYGQLGMNLVDGRAAELLRDLAPRTFDWLCALRLEPAPLELAPPRLPAVWQRAPSPSSSVFLLLDEAERSGHVGMYASWLSFQTILMPKRLCVLQKVCYLLWTIS